MVSTTKKSLRTAQLRHERCFAARMQKATAQVTEMRRVIARFADHVLLLVVGFDGVVVDYDPDPDAVRLSTAMRALLAGFGGRRDAELAVITGRRIADVRARAGLGDGVFYVGLHGLETAGPGFLRSTLDDVHQYRNRIDGIAAAFDSSTFSQGIRVEKRGRPSPSTPGRPARSTPSGPGCTR
jgi:hypothetical protein